MLFLARFFVPELFFSKSRLCTQPLFSHFVTNLDRLAGQLIQFFLRSRFFFVLFQIFYVFLRRVNPLGGNCMMTKASSWHGHQCDGGILGRMTSPTAIASAGLTMPIVLRCLCCSRHCLVSSLPLLPLASSLLFGIILAFVAIVAVIAIVAIAIFAPFTVALAAIVVTLAVITAWFLLSLLPLGIIVATVTSIAIVAIVAIVAVVALALFAPVAIALAAPVAVTLAAIFIPLAVVATTVLAVAATLAPS